MLFLFLPSCFVVITNTARMSGMCNTAWLSSSWAEKRWACAADARARRTKSKSCGCRGLCYQHVPVNSSLCHMAASLMWACVHTHFTCLAAKTTKKECICCHDNTSVSALKWLNRRTKQTNKNKFWYLRGLMDGRGELNVCRCRTALQEVKAATGRGGGGVNRMTASWQQPLITPIRAALSGWGQEENQTVHLHIGVQTYTGPDSHKLCSTTVTRKPTNEEAWSWWGIRRVLKGDASR